MTVARGYFVCECCNLQCPNNELLAWNERRPARRLKALSPLPDSPPTGEEAPGPYRTYMVNHQHRVCPGCHEHLLMGGEFHAITRNTGRLAFMILALIVGLLIACMPVLLPHLVSGFWRAEGESGR